LSEHTPPGWYPAEGDPPGTVRYWDGELWKGDFVFPPNQNPQYPNQYGYGAHATWRYAEWGDRAAATLIDSAVFGGALIVAYLLTIVAVAVSDFAALIVGSVTILPTLAASFYLLLWVPGVTGQSPGRRVMGYEIVSEQTGGYLGGGAFIGREFLGGLINNLCYIDYLWPLWDDKNQRLADKIVNSVAVVTTKGSLFPLFPSGKPF